MDRLKFTVLKSRI